MLKEINGRFRICRSAKTSNPEIAVIDARVVTGFSSDVETVTECSMENLDSSGKKIWDKYPMTTRDSVSSRSIGVKGRTEDIWLIYTKASCRVENATRTDNAPVAIVAPTMM